MTRPASITLRFLAEPIHVNFGGKVHGGSVMKWIDQAGYTCAAGWSGDYCVTAYIGGIRFLQPINVGEIVEVRAQLIRTGRTSMDVAVDIYASNPRSRTKRRSCHCVMTFVAVDEQGKPKDVPAWVPSSPIEKALEDHANRLNEIRRTSDQEIEAQLKWLDQQPPAETTRA
jgi:acyl-CoA hydrolase